MRVTTAVERPGRRVQLLSARAEVNGREVMRAVAWQLQAEPGRSPAAGPREEAPPFPPLQPQGFFPGLPTFPYGEALEWRFTRVTSRPRAGHRLDPLPDPHRGRAPSGLSRLVAMVDSANGVSWSSPSTLSPSSRWT